MPAETAPGFNSDLKIDKTISKEKSLNNSAETEVDNPVYEAFVDAGINLTEENKNALRFGTQAYDRLVDTCYKYMQTVIDSDSAGSMLTDIKIQVSEKLRRDFHESLGRIVLGVGRYEQLSYDQRKQLQIFAASVTGNKEWLRIFRSQSV